MGLDADFWNAVKRIRAKDDQFNPDVYPFMMQALEHTLQRIGERRHISAKEFLEGLCVYSRERFGLLAHEVLTKWGINTAFHVGLAVFHLVEAGVLSKRESDRLEDFDMDIDLRRALGEKYFD